MPAPTLYQLLDVSATASADDLRQAFRLLSKRYHPDTTSMPPPQAAAAFQRLQQAYGVLSDPEARRRYDSQLQLELAPPPALVVQRPLPVRRALSVWPCCFPWCSAWGWPGCAVLNWSNGPVGGSRCHDIAPIRIPIRTPIRTAV